MASWFLGINRGRLENPGFVSAGVATAATDFELRIDTGKSSTKEDVIKALRLFEQYLLSNYVPANSPGANQPPL